MDLSQDSPHELIIGITPFERPDTHLVRALGKAGALGVLDLGRDPERAADHLGVLGATGEAFGVRVPEGVKAPPLPEACSTVILTATGEPSQFGGRRVLVQATTLREAQAAVHRGAAGIIAKGAESGGRVAEESSFVLLQRLVRELDCPIWVQGGIGLHSAAACIAGGAVGVVLDVQLALLKECQLPLELERALKGLDGSETQVVGNHRIFVRPDLPIEKLAPRLPACLGGDSLQEQLIPMGQDAAFAAGLAAKAITTGGLVTALQEAIPGHLRQAQSLQALRPGGPMAAAHGIEFPIAQGPMTRVSDVASFALRVADAGALPFLALALMPGDRADALLAEASALLGDRPWGVGILGFVEPAIREAHLKAILKARPKVALIGGGRPAQARQLEARGIATYLHVPSPGLLDLFLREGSRRFIFEGRECGGHVGPRSSFVLWEQQIEHLLAFDALDEVHVFFAGGIHDARSAAMVATLAAPLSARGAKIGVLMGTAYLFTEEAISSGAIVPGFQEAAIHCEETVLLETSPGHASRCMVSHYVDTFQETRASLEDEGKTAEERWTTLEQLNLGRLRIASKGIRRESDALVEVEEATQKREGMYMVGQVAALRAEATTLAELHREVTVGATRTLEQVKIPERRRRLIPPADVAIVGMAAIYPGAPDTARYWSNVVFGIDSVTEVDSKRWDPAQYFDPASKDGHHTPSKWGGFLPTVDFDPLKFGIPPSSLAAIEPVQLLALETASRALEDAGYGERQFDRERASVIFGAEAGTDLSAGYGFRNLYRHYLGELPEALDAVLPSLTEDSFPGVLTNVIAGRIANRLDLGGVNYTVDAACGSSLAALDLACKELTGFTSDLVICGAADTHNAIGDYLLFASTHALSPSGRCRTFDAHADGITLGEGVAALVLKRLADAERDGDRIYSVIKSVGGSSDGRSLGLTAPRKEGQKRAVDRAYHRAGFSAAEVGITEAHGTGTVVGDRTELGTLTECFSAAGALPGSVTLGSVKSQIGHTKCAAGLAGVIKVSLALHRHALPPTLHVKKPNPAWSQGSSPFVFRKQTAPWPGKGHAGSVSAFGFGGTNFHAVLSAHDEDQPRIGVADWPSELFFIRDLADLEALAGVLEGDSDWRLREIAAGLAARGEGPSALCLIASDLAELRDRVASARAGVHGEGIYPRSDLLQQGGKIAFLFPGQGSQRPGMLSELMVAFPGLQSFLELDPELTSLIYPAASFDPETTKRQRAAVTDTRVAQPALGMVDLAAAALLSELGIDAQMLAGHSYGELVALCVGGAITPSALIALSHARADAILQAAQSSRAEDGPDSRDDSDDADAPPPPNRNAGDPGTMAAVAAGADLTAAALASLEGVSLVNFNSPKQTVIAGTHAAIAAALARLETEGLAAREIPVACAFHSPIVAGAEPRLARFLETLPLKAPTRTVFGNTEAAPLPEDPSALRAVIAKHVARPVRFVDEIEAMYEAGARVFVEVGPGRVLSDLCSATLGDQPHLAVSLEGPSHQGLTGLVHALGQLAAAGVKVDPCALFEGREGRTFDLDAPELKRSAALWKINGHRAVPVHGALPPHGLQLIGGPLQLGLTPGAGPTGSGDRDEVMVEYLRGVRQLASAQRDVLLSYLGTPLKNLAVNSAGMTVEAQAVRSRSGAASAESANAPLPDTAQAAPPPPPKDTRSPGEILLSIVSERTGYPESMLELDLDLEADLSIDSIKRVEIIGLLAETLQLGGGSGSGAATEGGEAGGDARDALIEALARVKTLRGILEWLEAQNQPQDGAPEQSPQAGKMTAAHVVPEHTLRFVFEGREAPALERRGSLLTGKHFVLHGGETPLVTALRKRLEGAGAHVRTSQVGQPYTEGERLLILDPLQKNGALRPAKRLFKLASTAREALMAGARAVLVATDLGPNFGRNATHDTLIAAGVAGLFKTIAREWPKARVRCVHLDPRDDTEVHAEHLHAEAMAQDELKEVGWFSGHRQVLVPVARARETQTAPRLEPNSVVLLTGGARGITARIALALAKESTPTLILVGRSEVPPEQEVTGFAEASNLVDLRSLAISRGLAANPAEAEQVASRLLSDRAMRATFEALNASGCRYEYQPCDVRDRGAFGRLIDGLYERHGKIDVVLHGAGILEDRLLVDKDEESFTRVVDTKVEGALTLEAHLNPKVHRVIFFGSVAGVFGNRGQADYAAANDVLDKLAQAMNQRIEGRAVSLDWGPWGGGGMVSEALEQEYARLGIGLIDPEDGVRCVLEELGSEQTDSQVLYLRADPAALA